MKARFPFYLLADSVDGMTKEAAAERKAFSRRPVTNDIPTARSSPSGDSNPSSSHFAAMLWARGLGLQLASAKSAVVAPDNGLLTGSVSTDTGKGRELIAIAAVVIGGTLLSGGIGSVLGTFVGLLLMQLIFNVIVFENGRGTMSISSYWESVIRGAFLLIVVLVQARVAKRRRR